MSLQLDTVFVWVTSIEEALPFYRALGIEPGPRFGTWQTMDVGGDTRFALHEGDRPSGPSTSVPSFRVEDLESEISRLKGLGIHPSDSEITNTGLARFITFADPDGNQIQLLER